jgi:hypothetical protein
VSGGGFDLFGNDHDQGLFSAGLSATSVDWSHYDIDFSTSRTAENFAPSNYSQPLSLGGFEFNGSEQAPTLTTTASGEVSEAEDFMGTSVEDWDPTSFGTSASGHGFSMSAGQSLLPSRGDMALDSMKFLKQGDNKFLPQPPASLAGDELSLGSASGFSFVDDDPAIWMPDYHHGLPAVRDSPDLGILPWEAQ